MKANKNVDHFKKCVKEAIEFFGLHSFQFHITEQLKKDSRASNYYHSVEDSDARMFTICYSLDWVNDEATTLEDLRRTAFHEIFESMFYKLREFSKNTSYVVSEREVDSEIHSIIRTFENKMFGLIK